MKRDLDLIRRVLLAMESDAFVPGTELRVRGERAAVVAYHVYLLQREHLIDALEEAAADTNDPWYVPMALMPAGREWLDAARDDARWRGFLDGLGARSWSMTLRAVATALAADAARGEER